MKIFSNKFVIYIFIFSFLWIFSSQFARAYTTKSGTISANETWQSGQTYLVQNVTINSGVTVTVEPSAIIKFNTDSYLTVNGTLDVNGTSASKSYFTSTLDDSIGENTSPGDSTAPSAGNWDQIQLNSGASVSMDNTIVRFGGSGYLISSNMYMTGGVFSISNSTIASSSYYGIYIASGSADISNNTIKDNVRGVSAYGSGTLNLNNNTFIDNSDYPATFGYSSGRIVNASGNTASGTGKKGYLVAGSATVSQTWGDDMPYIIPYDGFTVNSGKILTLQPGAIIKFDSTSSHLTVAGQLIANGTSNDKIYFTSLKDDSVGGDTNNDDDSTSPGVGNWRHIKFNSGSTASISYSVIRFGANATGGSYSNMYITGGIVDISFSTIASAYYYGIFQSGGTSSITNSSIYDNYFGFYNTTATVSAEYNYWGHSSGPTHGTNPSGTGSTVSNFIDFGPWLSEPPSATYIPVTGFINSNSTWSGSTPYVIGSGGVTVNSGKTLTLDPGTIVKMASTSSHLTVNGRLDAVGTLGNRIYFTSLKDDTVGGDTNGDGGGTTPVAGNWNTIRFNSGSTGSISYSNIGYGGSANGSAYSNLLLNGGVLDVSYSSISDSLYYGVGVATGIVDITDSVIEYNDQYGVYVDGGTTTISASILRENIRGITMDDGTVSINDSSISGNYNYGVYNNTLFTNIDAEDNWWGHASGAYPGGLGDAVTDNVDFTPYRTDWDCRNWPDWNCTIINQDIHAVNELNQITWWASTSYNTEWTYARDTWDDFASVSFSEVASSGSPKTLRLLDVDDSGFEWIGQYSYDPDGVDFLHFNDFYMEPASDDLRKFTATHELGHALGLHHSFWGNIMFYTVPSPMYSPILGPQDIKDYNNHW